MVHLENTKKQRLQNFTVNADVHSLISAVRFVTPAEIGTEVSVHVPIYYGVRGKYFLQLKSNTILCLGRLPLSIEMQMLGLIFE